MTHIWSTFAKALTASYANLPTSLWQAGAMLLGFIILASFYNIVVAQNVKPHSLRLLALSVFRPEFQKSATSHVDRWHYIFIMAFWLPLSVAVLTSLSAAIGIDINQVLKSHFGRCTPFIQQTWLIVAVQTLGIYLFKELGEYTIHYCFHRVPILWSFHRAHHSAEVLTAFTSQRGHPLEFVWQPGTSAIFGGIGGGLILYLTGTDLRGQTIAALSIIALAIEIPLGFAYHSHIPISFGWFNRIIYAPVLHQVHHSAELRHRDKNIGNRIAIFDWMFGTLYLPDGKSFRVGLNDEEMGDKNPHLTLRQFYLEPFQHAWKNLK